MPFERQGRITTVQGYHFQREEQKLQCADIASRIGDYSRALGHYEVASKMGEAALTVRQELLGKEHPEEHEQPSVSAEGSGQVRAGGRDIGKSSECVKR